MGEIFFNVIVLTCLFSFTLTCRLGSALYYVFTCVRSPAPAHCKTGMTRLVKYFVVQLILHSIGRLIS